MGSFHVDEYNVPNIIKIILSLSIFTVSFDVFLTIDIGGTFRITQFLALIVIAYTFFRIWKMNLLNVPLGGVYLFVWIVWLLMCVLKTNELGRSIGYWLWLVQDGLLVVAMSNLLNTKKDLYSLLRIYIVSFVFVSVFGLFQFFSAPFLGMGTPLVTQWWIYGVLARINAFSYEPSYFATYLLIGWSILYVLWRKKNAEMFSLNIIKLFLLILSITMILSSSRMGILMIMLLSAEFFLSKIYFCIKKIFLAKQVKIKGVVNVAFIVGFLLLLGNIVHTNDFSEYEFLLSGTGLGGQAAHSVDERSERAIQTLDIFFENPLMGIGIGGVPEHIAKAANISASLKEFEGNAVIFEVLAASGIIGIVPFLLYFFELIAAPLKRFRKSGDSILLALIVALVFELVILQFNQNILRPYLWLHIAILSKYYQMMARLNRETV